MYYDTEEELNKDLTLDNPTRFQEKVKYNSDFLLLAKYYPQSTQKLIDYILKNKNEFKRLITGNYTLIATAEKFPNSNKELAEYLINNTHEFQRLIKNKHDLIYTLNTFPNHSNELINQALTITNTFKRVIYNYEDLNKCATEIPTHADKLIYQILTSEEEFTRIFDYPFKLKETAKSFPQYGMILKKSSIEEANRACKLYLQSLGQIKNTIRTITLDSRATTEQNSPNSTKPSQTTLNITAKPSFFSRVPNELLINIAAMTGNPYFHNHEKATQIATETFTEVMSNTSTKNIHNK